MNLTPKILLTINLEGVLSKMTEERKASYKFATKANRFEIVNVIEDCRIPSICQKKTTLSKYSYDYFISNEIPESWPLKRAREWTSMSKKDRLNYHLSQIAYPNSFTFEVLED